MVPREYRRTVPSGCACSRAAIARTTLPRSLLVSLVSAASAITAHRCSAISCRIFSSITRAPPSAVMAPVRVMSSWEA